MKKLTPLFIFLFLASTSYSTFAQSIQVKPPVRFLVGFAAEFGGDEVAEIEFTDGETQSVYAGQGISGAVGAEIQIPNVKQLLFHTTIGLKYVTTQADNAHIRLTRIPIHLTANWLITDDIRFGGGLALHRAINFKADGIGPDVEFDPANGYVFEVAYKGIGFSYTIMEYTDPDDFTYSANSAGLTFKYAF